MIHWFEVQNLLSFLEVSRVNMTPGKAVDDFSVFTSTSGERLSKFCAIVGANASGKSNLLKGLATISRFIVSSFKFDEADSTGFTPHFFAPDKQSRVALQFELQTTDSEQPQVYRYEVEATKSHVIFEKLSIKTSAYFSRVYERLLDGDSYQFKGVSERHYAKMPKNASMISWFARQNLEVATKIRDYFANVSCSDSLYFGRMPGSWRAIEAIEIYRNAPAIHTSMVEILQKWDFGIQGIDFVKQHFPGNDGKEEFFWNAHVVHGSDDLTATLPLVNESSGTIELFSHLGSIFKALESGGIVVLDEIEDGLHPDLVEAMLELFLMPESNPKNAQLLFTTHSHWIMDFLNKWQVVLVEKRNCASSAWHVSSMRGVEKREVLSKLYRSGSLGAVPRRL